MCHDDKLASQPVHSNFTGSTLAKVAIDGASSHDHSLTTNFLHLQRPELARGRNETETTTQSMEFRKREDKNALSTALDSYECARPPISGSKNVTDQKHKHARTDQRFIDYPGSWGEIHPTSSEKDSEPQRVCQLHTQCITE